MGEPASDLSNRAGLVVVQPPVPDEEASLVTRAQAGDLGAFEQLVRATSAETYTLALRLTGNEEDARDVVQETYLRAYRGLDRFRGEARFSTWLYRITANCAATHLARRGRHRHDELTEELAGADDRPAVDPQLQADAAGLRDELQVALQALPDSLRAVVVLRDVYDLTHEEIARELGISQTAAKVRLHRARRRLREQLYPLPVDAPLEEVGHDAG